MMQVTPFNLLPRRTSERFKVNPHKRYDQKNLVVLKNSSLLLHP
jgi:hypothetical protein